MGANGKERILIVDDNPHLLKGQARILEKAGYETFQADTGEEGVEIARKVAPDLVLLDVLLPGIDGREACRRIKEKNSGIFVILLSSLNITSDQQAEGLEVGADGYIARPVTNRELVARVRAMFRIKNAEAALGKSEYRCRSIIENAGIGITVVDNRGVLVAANPAFCEMTGFKKEELVGLEAPFPFWPGDLSDTERVGLEQLLKEGKVHFETRRRRKDGSVFPASESASPILDVFGFPEFYIGFVQDITEKKRAEDALLRVRKLESIGSMVGGMAHDLNNLLGVIIGNIELALLDAQAREDLKENLSQAIQASLVARDLIRKYGDFSQNEGADKYFGSLDKLVYQTVESFAGENRIEFDVFVSESLRPAKIDPNQIRKALSEIIANAIEAMGGEGTVRIRVENAEPREIPPELKKTEDACVKIVVGDHGPGIAEKDRQRIFDPYFSTKSMGSTKGMGFGLAIAYAAVRNHNGSIRVSPTPEGGAEFAIFLPCRTK